MNCSEEPWRCWSDTTLTALSRSTADEDGDGDDPDGREARAYAFNSRALPLLHLVVGILNNLQAVAWREWLIHGACEQQGLNPADQALLSGVVCALPWNLKIFIAFLSDVRSICGSRRVAYLLIGLFLQGGGCSSSGWSTTRRCCRRSPRSNSR